MLRRLLGIGLVAAAISLNGTAVRSETTLTLSNWIPPTHLVSSDIVEVWAKNVELATNGRVKVDVVSALGKPQAHFDLVKNGVADVAMGVHGYTAERFKLSYGVNLPFYADNATASSVAFWRTHQKYFKQAGEFEGVKLITLWTHGPGAIHTRDKRITSIEDLENLKLRAPGGVVQDIAEEIGVTPHFAPASEAYELLSKGVIDGIFFDVESLLGFNIADQLNYSLTFPGGLYRDAHYMVMNQNTWDELSEQDQKAIMAVSGETMAWIAGKAWDAHDVAATNILRAQGHEVREAEGELLEEVKKRVANLEEEWIERANEMGVDGKAALEFYAAEIEKME